MMTDIEIIAPGRLVFPNGGEIHIDSLYEGQVCYRLFRPDANEEDVEWLRTPIAQFIKLVREENGARWSTDPPNPTPEPPMQDSPDVRERIARAIYDTSPVGVRRWEDAPTSNREDCFACAGAALSTLTLTDHIAAVEAAGYIVRMPHDWGPFGDPHTHPFDSARRCKRCGTREGGLLDAASCTPELAASNARAIVERLRDVR